MKPYSLDLRQRVVAAAESGVHTIAEVADLFGVGQTFVKKMLRLHRQGESLEPGHGGGAPAALNKEHQKVLRAAVQRQPDATLGELKEQLALQCQITVSEATICRQLQVLNLPRKKRVFKPVNAMSGNAARSVARRPSGR